jgi:hypothetical protein
VEAADHGAAAPFVHSAAPLEGRPCRQQSLRTKHRIGPRRGPGRSDEGQPDGPRGQQTGRFSGHAAHRHQRGANGGKQTRGAKDPLALDGTRNGRNEGGALERLIAVSVRWVLQPSVTQSSGFFSMLLSLAWACVALSVIRPPFARLMWSTVCMYSQKNVGRRPARAPGESGVEDRCAGLGSAQALAHRAAQQAVNRATRRWARLEMKLAGYAGAAWYRRLGDAEGRQALPYD